MKTRILVAGFYWLLVSFLAGCGYTTRSMILDEYRTIYVKPFVNKIDITSETDVAIKYKVYRPRLETDVTKGVSNRYLFDGNLKPVKSENADLTLKGELKEFRRDPLRYDESNNVQEYRINILVDLSLYDNREDKMLWQESNFTGYASYFTSGPSATSEDSAVSNAISDLARRVVERTVEKW